jgi:Uma2 family endonuclease
MATELKTKPLSAEEFLAADLGEGTFELIRGEVVAVSPPMPEHGLICGNIIGFLWNYGRTSGLGYVLSNDTAVLTSRGPDTVRGPDVCFYRQDRWPRSEVGRGLPPVPPDLVVEVLSPGNRTGETLVKVGEYLKAGVASVWVVDPGSKEVAIYSAKNAVPQVLAPGDVVENVPGLPGFRCPVADLFL